MAYLRDLLLQPALSNGAVTFETLPGAGKPSLSQKNWVQGYPEVQDNDLTLYVNPDQNTIHSVFGNANAFEEQLLNKVVSPLNETYEWLQKEGDSVRAFYTKVSLPIQLAFHTQPGTPFIIQRSESGPLGTTHTAKTIDFTWGFAQHCLMIGELKRHGIIDAEKWMGRGTDHNRRWLGKELRGYCHLYKCFAASVFDGMYLLILVFEARTVEHIKQANCAVTGLLFERDYPTLRYGFFRAVTHQIRRMQAAEAPALILGGYVRRHARLTGRPYWADGNGQEVEHPDGYIRVLHPSGAWFWASQDGNAVLDVNGNVVWDTRSLNL